MSPEFSEHYRRREASRDSAKPKETFLPDDLFDIAQWRKSLSLVFSRSDESDRRNNSALAKTGELGVNRPRSEQIPNLKTLTSLSLFQPASSMDKHEEGGTDGFYRSLNYHLDNLLKNTSAPSSFAVYTKDPSGRLVPKKIKASNGRVFFNNEQIYPHLYQNRWRFPKPFLEDCIAYKVTEETATYTGIGPCLDNNTLREYIRVVTEGKEDVTLLQYRGHNGYGSGAKIPEDLLDPAIVFLGGCKSNRFLGKAQKHHSRSGIMALNHKTGWEINHHRARSVMKALQQLKKTHRGKITWEDLSEYLRTSKNGQERFGKEKMVLPGDEIN